MTDQEKIKLLVDILSDIANYEPHMVTDWAALQNIKEIARRAVERASK